MSPPGRVVIPSLVAGALVALSVPPSGLWPMAIPGIALLAWLIDQSGRGRTRALAGLAFGVGLFGPTLFWINEFHAVGYVLLVFLEASFFAAAAALTRRALALPAACVLAEWARGAVPFGGLPMGGLPLGQAGGPLAPSARIGGAYLLAGLVVALGVAAYLASRRRWTPAAVVAGGVVVAGLLGAVAPDGTRTGELDVALVQGGGQRGFRAVDTDPQDVFDAHLAASQGLVGPLDLVVWPENAIDVPAIDGSDEADALASIARRLQATVVAGVTQDAGADNFENLAVAWSPEGRMVDRYVKVHRVPFGEYVPLRGLLERVVDLHVLPRDALGGDGRGVLRTPAGDFGVAISYEVFFGDRARVAADAGGRLLLVPTNTASFTTTQVPTQEIAAARLRAWETGRWVLMSAPTGYGAIIDHEGRVLDRTTLSRRQLLVGRAELRSGRTIYTAAGDAPVVALAALALAIGWRRSRGPAARTGGRVEGPLEEPPPGT